MSVKTSTSNSSKSVGKNHARTKQTNIWMFSTIALAVLLLVMTVTTIILSSKVSEYKSGVLMYEARPEVAKPTSEVLNNDLEITYNGNFVYANEPEKNYTDMYQEITVKNKSNKTLTFNITFEATNSDGSERLANDYLAVEDLAPGQSQTFEIFEDLSTAKAQEFVDKGVKFNVTKAIEFDK